MLGFVFGLRKLLGFGGQLSTAGTPIGVGNPNHHLWNNNGTWWLHVTILHRGIRQERLRRSLRTRSLELARLRRDRFIRRLAGCRSFQLSIRRVQQERGALTSG